MAKKASIMFNLFWNFHHTYRVLCGYSLNFQVVLLLVGPSQYGDQLMFPASELLLNHSVGKPLLKQKGSVWLTWQGSLLCLPAVSNSRLS